MQLPDPEQLLQQLAAALKPRLRANTALVGIHSGGAWVAQQLQQRLGGLLPLGTLDSCPLGLSLIARRGGDEMLLRLAATIV